MAFTLEQENALLNLLNEKRTTLSELPAAAGINEDDLFLTRQGISDKSVTTAVIRKTLAPQASLAESGVVQLTNSTEGDRQDVATTPKAVNAAIRKPATLTGAGTVKLTNTIDADNQQDAVTPKGVFDVLKDASLDEKGLVQLSNSINSNSETLAASSAAVKAVADKLPKMVILYPNGSAELPDTIAANQRVVIDNPFPGAYVICRVEILYNGLWGEPNHSSGWNSTDYARGVSAGQLSNDTIVVQSGDAGVLLRSNLSCNPFGVNSNVGSAPYRVLVWRITE